MWVKYTGKITYNSMDVRGFKPDTSRSVSEEIGKHLIKKFPKKFHLTKAEVVKEAPKEDEKVEKSEDKKKEKSEEVKKINNEKR